MDVAIAYLAVVRGYILATGDLGQFPLLRVDILL